MVSFEKEGKKWGGKKNREEKEKKEIKGKERRRVAVVPLYSKYLHLGNASRWKN